MVTAPDRVTRPRSVGSTVAFALNAPRLNVGVLCSLTPQAGVMSWSVADVPVFPAESLEMPLM